MSRNPGALGVGQPSAPRFTLHHLEVLIAVMPAVSALRCLSAVLRPHPSLDRLARSLQDLIAIVTGPRRRGTGFHSLKEALDTTTPGRFALHAFAALAGFIHEPIIEGTDEGLAAARARRETQPSSRDDP